MPDIITFYDIPSTVPGNAWSPNTQKTRYCLNFKGIPYKTVWVEYPDIEPLCKRIGAAPTSQKEDGSPYYTLPVIHDPSTGAVVADSVQIAKYLDDTYGDTPKVFPPGTYALQLAAIKAHQGSLTAVFPIILPLTPTRLNPPSQEYFRRTREIYFGKPLEEVIPKGKQLEEEWAKVEAGWSLVDGWLRRASEDGPYFLGNNIGFFDFAVASYTLWLKNVFGEDSEEWKQVKTWNEGRSVQFVELLEKYEKVVF